MKEYLLDARGVHTYRFWRGVAMVAVATTTLLVIGFGAGVATMWVFGPELRHLVAPALPGAAETLHDPSGQERFSLLTEIWTILDKEFYDPDALDDGKMTQGAAAGLVSSVGDPHTVYVEPRQAAIMDQEMQGSFEGIGVSVEMVDGRLVIVKPLPNSPALEAGLRAGDTILAVDDEPLEGKSILDVVALIKGPRGTVVLLLVQREGTPEPFIVPITRDKVEFPIIESRMLEGDIAYLRLKEFNAISQKRVRSALSKLLADDPVGLVLDLRENPGGLLSMAVDIASEFLPEGTLILTEEQRDRAPREYRVERQGIATSIPLVVLVNGASASAAEIVAAAIHDSDRGILIGEQTFGKSAVQSTHKLSEGSSLRVTIAKWYPPNREHLDAGGIEPDIRVVLSEEDLAMEVDGQLERAVAHLLNGE